MRKILIIALLFAFGAALFGYVIYQTGLEEIRNNVAQLSIRNFAFYLLLGINLFWLQALRWKLILKGHCHNVSIVSLFFYRLASFGVNFITPVQIGGEPVRVMLLSSEGKVSLRDSTASCITDKLFELSALVMFIAAGVIYLIFTNLVPARTEWLLGGIIVIFIALLIMGFRRIMNGSGLFRSAFVFLRLNKIARFQHVEEKIERTEKKMAEFLCHTDHQRTTIPKVCLLSVAIVSFSILEHWLLAWFLNINLTFTQAFLVSTIPLIAYLLPIPMGIGVFEAAHIALFALFGFSSGTALAIAIAIRTKDIIAALMGFTYATTHGVHIMGRKRNIPTAKELRTLSREGVKASALCPDLSQQQPHAHHQTKEQEQHHQFSKSVQK